MHSQDQRLEIPPIDIYIQNAYKKYSVPEVTNEMVAAMIEINGIEVVFQPDAASRPDGVLQAVSALFGFISFINYGAGMNIVHHRIGSTLNVIETSRAVKAGEEIIMDQIYQANDE